MCGLVGGAGYMLDRDKEAVTMMLYLDYLRGKHSTGLLTYWREKTKDDDKGWYKVNKALGHPFNLWKGKDFDNGVPTQRGMGLMMGHNRAATVGNVTIDNAHPFECGDIIGAHNGTLISKHKLDDHKDFETDSEAIFHNINKDGIEKVVPKLHGAYALTFFNLKENKLYIIRNDKRTLYYTRRKDKDVIFWASEAWMLEVALARCKIAHEEIVPFEKDILYSFDISEVGIAVRNKDLVQVGKMEGYVTPPFTYNYTYGAGSYGRTWPHKSTTPNKGQSVVPFDRREPKSSDFNVREKYSHLVGSEVEFWVGGEYVSKEGHNYLVAFPNNFDAYEIRLFDNGSRFYKELKYSNKLYIGMLKGFKPSKTTTGGFYGKIKWNSVFEKNEEHDLPAFITKDNNSEEEYIGFGGRYLTKDEWDKATKDGCAWCSSNEAKPGEVKFINHTTYVCNSCKDDPNLQQYLGVH